MAAKTPALGFKAYFMINQDKWAGPQGPMIICTDNPDPNTPMCPVIINYVAEGAANVIWSVLPESSIEDVSPDLRLILKDKLLRLRKGTTKPEVTSNIGPKPPPFFSTSEVYDHFTSKIVPHFQDDQLVRQEQVYLFDIISQCTRILKDMETATTRPSNRRGWYIEPSERCGLFITSMLPSWGASLVFHFKPKWLLQSPTAPPNARRCRTCALQAQRGKVRYTFCPLVLSSGDAAIIRPQIGGLNFGEIVVRDPDPANSQVSRSADSGSHDQSQRYPFPMGHASLIFPALTGAFTRESSAFPILQKLSILQQKYDPKGVRELCNGSVQNGFTWISKRATTTKQDITDLSMAMTLRDTTMFVKLLLTDNAMHVSEVRLADLDPKSGDDLDRVRKWWEDEDRLIREGWYLGTENIPDGQPSHTTCLLWNQAS